MAPFLISLISGIVFAIGLSISGMINPHKVKGFLDVFGNWDYSLVFVMGGAVVFNFISFKILSQKKPLCADEHFWPNKKEVDRKLIIGSALFGIGWGLVGICPGPALVNLIKLDEKIFVFVISMVVGMLAHQKWTST